MTNPPRRYTGPSPLTQQGCTSLPGIPETAALLRVRILPAQFARMIGVSKQTVSRWIAADKVSINPVDGRLDPQLAINQVLRNTDPGRMRVRLLQMAVGDVNEMRQALGDRVRQVEALAARLEKVQAELGLVRADLQQERANRIADELRADRREDAIVDAVVMLERDFRACPDSSAWRELAERLQETDYGPAGDVEDLHSAGPSFDDDADQADALAALALPGSHGPHHSLG